MLLLAMFMLLSGGSLSQAYINNYTISANSIVASVQVVSLEPMNLSSTNSTGEMTQASQLAPAAPKESKAGTAPSVSFPCTYVTCLVGLDSGTASLIAYIEHFLSAFRTG